MRMNVLITNARVVDPSQELDAKLDLLIEDGLIARADKRIKADIETIDANGLIAVPGLIDLHTHLREPGQEHKETIATGTRAAVAGGYTAVCAMANTLPPNDERAVTEMIIAESRRNGACRVYPIGAVSKGLKGEALAELADLRAAGCVGVSDDGKPVWNAQLMRRALEYCAAGHTGVEVFVIANADTVMSRPSAELAAEVFPDVPVTRPLGEHETLLSIDKARRVLGYAPEHSWRIVRRGDADPVPAGRSTC